ncbi:MAG: homocysteine S-methyltransferase family protein [Nocardioides sp.]
MPTDLRSAIARRPVVLDGGWRLGWRPAATTSPTSSGRPGSLLDEPEEVRAAHADFFAVGAEVAITASYQVSFAGLAARGVDRAGTERLLRLKA